MRTHGKFHVVVAAAVLAAVASCGPRPGGHVQSAAPPASDDEVLAGAIMGLLAMGTDEKAVEMAVQVLVDLGPAASAPVLQAWDGANDGLRRICLLVLGQMDPMPGEAGRLATEALESDDRRLKAQAMTVLGLLCRDDPGFVDILLEAAEGDDDVVGRAAMAALGGCGTGDPRVLETLLSSLEIDEDAGGIEGIAALGEQAAPALPALMTYIASDEETLAEAAARTLEKLGPAAAPVAGELTEAYLASEYGACLYLGDALLAVRGTEAFASFLRMMQDAGDGGCAYRAGELVQQMGPDAVPLVIEAFAESDDVGLRSNLVESLETRGADPDVVVPFLVVAFTQDDGEHELDVEDALIRMGNPVVGPLAKLYEGGQPSERWLAVRVLRWFGHVAEAMRTLLSATADEDERIRIEAIAGVSLAHPGPGEVQAVLDRALTDEKSGVRQAGYRLLFDRRDGIVDVVGRLLAGLEDPDAGVRSTVAGLLPMLLDPEHVKGDDPILEALRATLAKDGDPHVRSLAAEGLSQIRDESEPTIDALTKALDDKAPPVVEQAATALARIGPPAGRASAKLASLLKKGKVDQGSVAWALAAVDPGSKALAKWLGKAIKSKDEAKLAPAVRVASMIRPCPGSVIAALVDVATENTAQQRSAAALALAMIGEAGVLALADLVHEVDEDLDLEIAQVLWYREIDATPAFPGLLELLDDEDSDIRSLATSALGNVDPCTNGLENALVGRLDDEDEDVRLQAALQLLRHDLSTTRAVGTFVELIDDPYFRESALSALDLCGSACSEMLDTLLVIFEERMAAREQAPSGEAPSFEEDEADPDWEDMEEDDEPSTGWDGSLDWVLISSIESMLVASPENVPLLIAMRTAGGPHKKVIELLGQIGAPARLAILDMLRTGTVEEQKLALSMLVDLQANDEETISLIEQVAATGAPEAQIQAASMLCRLDPPGVDAMVAALSQETQTIVPTPDLMGDIMCVVGSIGGWRTLIGEMQDGEAAEQIQKELEDASVPVILAALASGDDGLRYLAMACIVVSLRGLPEARSDLVPLLTHESKVIRTLSSLAIALELGEETPYLVAH